MVNSNFKKSKYSQSKPFWQSRFFVPAMLSVLIAVFIVIQLFSVFREMAVSKSSATLIVDPQQSFLELPINKPIDLNGMTQQQILDIRAEQVNKYPNLIQGQYSPTGLVFNNIQEDGYWMSLARLYYVGKKSIKSASPFFKESVASTIVLNPFLLAKAEFWGLSIWGAKNLKWNKALYSLEALSAREIPLAPVEQVLQISPAQGSAEIIYDISDFIYRINPALQKPLTSEQISFGLSMQNARDFGFRYAYLDLENSINIKNDQQPTEALEIGDRFEYMPLAWTSRLKLNHSSPNLPQFQSVQAISVPAKAVIKFWYEQPKDLKDPANYNFTINIR